MLTPQENERYVRQMVLPEVGPAGQERLGAASVLVVGVGALGSASSIYLAAAGVGRIGLVDADRVERSNLHRQIVHGESSVGRSKLASALARLAETNPQVKLEPHDCYLNAANARAIAASYDLIIDGADNFPARFLCNDLGYFLRKPVVHASVLRFAGQVAVFAPHQDGPCYRCLLPAPPAPGAVPSCAEAGVLGAMAGVMGSLQALEALKWILGVGESLTGRMVHFDGLRGRWREFRLRRDPSCPLCGPNPRVTRLVDEEEACGIATVEEIDAALLRDLLASGWNGLLVDVREPSEHAAGSIPGAALHPLGSLPEAIPALKAEFPPDREIVLNCQSGRRSLLAARQFQEAGFTRVRHLRGGYLAWKRAGG